MKSLSGSNECYQITESTVSVVKEVFKKCLNSKTHQLFSWGSVARRDMGPRSDLDLVILSEYPNIESIEQFKQAIEKELPDNRLDLLEAYHPDTLRKIAGIDGTDRQAALFLRNELNPHNANQWSTKVREDTPGNLKDLFHVLSNMEFVYPNLFGINNLKFSPGSTKDFVFAHLLANFLENYKGMAEVSNSLDYFAEKELIPEQTIRSSKKNLDAILYLRNRVQEIRYSYHAILDEDTLKTLARDINLDKEGLEKEVRNIQRNTRGLYTDLKHVLIEESKRFLTPKDYSNIESLLFHQGSDQPEIVKEIIDSGSEISMMMLAYATKDPKVLEKIRKRAPQSWYVCYGIANNPHSSEKTLIRLMVPETKQKSMLEELYTGFAWRNIYLYIAKNPSATDKIREHIINYPNARPMDIEVAKKTEK